MPLGEAKYLGLKVILRGLDRILSEICGLVLVNVGKCRSIQCFAPLETQKLGIVLKVRITTISTGERPFIDILQDRRYWVIHLITIPSLFLAGVIFILSGFVYKLFGVANFMRYFYNVPINTQISLINDRFSIFLFIEDV